MFKIWDEIEFFQDRGWISWKWKILELTWRRWNILVSWDFLDKSWKIIAKISWQIASLVENWEFYMLSIDFPKLLSVPEKTCLDMSCCKESVCVNCDSNEKAIEQLTSNIYQIKKIS